MTIKQLGGVFGRNPTFNDVTIEGTLTFDGDIDITSDLTIEDNLYVLGSVGIGSTSPIAALDVTGTDSAGSLTSLGDTVTRAAAVIRGSTHANGYGLYMGYGNSTTDAQYIQATRASGSTAFPLLLNPYGGNVGIGETSPSTPLHVNSGTGNTVATFESTDAGSYINLIDNGSGTYGAMIGAVSDDIVFSPNNVEAMRIDSSGNVGIGTSSPSGLMSFAKGSRTLDLKLEDTAATGDVGIQLRAGSGDYFGIAAGGGTGVGIVIDDSNNVGIGTSSPALPLHVLNSSAALAYFESNSANGPYVIWRSAGTNIGDVGSAKGISGSGNATDFMIASRSTNPLILGTGSTERMRIDSSGNLLVGKTSSSLSTAGTEIYGTGVITSTRNGNILDLNRLSTDGNIVQFRKDGATVGSIGTSGSRIYIGGQDVGLDFEGLVNEAILPFDPGSVVGRDDAISLGSGSYRFKDIYATNGTIQTSDRNEKQDIEALSDAEQRVAVAAKGLLRKFRWKSSVEEKGDEARIHFGIIAQDLQSAFASEGLDAGRYGMFINSTWTDEETGEERSRMGVRYSELLAFIIAAI